MGFDKDFVTHRHIQYLPSHACTLRHPQVGLDNEEEVCAVGRRFRDTVLSLGGGTHPAEVFRAFRGRDPSPEALLRHSGLA